MAAFKTIAAGADWQDKTYHTEIERALYERFTVSGAVGKPTWATATGSTTAGAPIQAASFWNARQTAFETLVVNAQATHPFVSAGTAGTPATDLTSLEGLTTVPTFSTSAQLWTLVSGNPAGPRRQRVAGEWLYGKCTAGDIIGPWLIQDLQLAARFLKWTLVTTFTGDTWYKRYEQDGGHTNNWVDAAPPYNVPPWSAQVAQFNVNMHNEDTNDEVYTFWVENNPVSPFTDGSAIGVYRQTYEDNAYGNWIWHWHWSKSFSISPALSTALSKKYILLAHAKSWWLTGSVPFFAWHHHALAEGQIAVIGTSPSWQTTNQSTDMRSFFPRVWDTNFTPPTGDARKISACQYYSPKAGVLWNFSNT